MKKLACGTRLISKHIPASEALRQHPLLMMVSFEAGICARSGPRRGQVMDDTAFLYSSCAQGH